MSLPTTHSSDRQSQRDCVPKPRVARNELPWVNCDDIFNPNGVASNSSRLTATPGFVAESRLGFFAENELWAMTREDHRTLQNAGAFALEPRNFRQVLECASPLALLGEGGEIPRETTLQFSYKIVVLYFEQNQLLPTPTDKVSFVQKKVK